MTASCLLRRLLLAAVAWTLLPTTGVAADKKAKINYDEHILPIFREKCMACHNGDKQSGGLDLSTYSALMQGGASGDVVKAGDPDASRLYTLTAHTEEPKMPPRSPRIADESIATLKQWIVQGLLEKGNSKPIAIKPKADVTLSSITRGRPEGPPPMPTTKLRLDPVVVAPRPNAVIALAASPWAPLIAVGGQKQVLLYNTDTMQLVGVLPFQYGLPTVLRFSRNGSLLLAGGGRGGQSGKVVVWNVKTGETIIEVGNETDSVLAADISADQTLIALGGPNKMVRVYSTKDATLQYEMKKHTDWIYSVEFSPDGVLLATADRTGGLLVWEAANGREFYNLRGHTAGITDMSWRDDSNVLATTSEDSTVRLWEMENGSNFKTFGAHGGGSQGVKFSHDNRLVTNGRDRTPKIWDQNGGQQRAFEAVPDVGLRVAITHENAKLIATDWTGMVKVYNVADGKVLGTLSANPPTLAEQIALVTKDVAAKQVAFDAAQQAFTATEANLKKANDELAAAQANVTKTAAEAKAAADAVPGLKAKADQATAALTAAQMVLQARTAKLQSLQGVANQLKANADANKANAEFAKVAAEAKTAADQAQAEVAAAQKAVADADAAAKAMTAAYTAGVAKVTATQQAAQAAVQAVPPKQAAIKPAMDAVAPAKAKLDAAAADLNAVKANLDNLKAAPVAAK
ncbi:c-type cytochrome domain-containing protein [Tuwongella immobilis]|uniref:Cytochrome c domain-containing protein n=1 Tax=Tuwongella immobilis TaxID=692036 RepID=A0A6C2YRY5_9BACT|nr:c-type cytochrome domain-containing protein [Tuwongella immobilis]VIP04121.1 repeat-containing protein : WD40 repeat-containing protein OS=Singulisphaera acidiphila (strain ATCC BAA-1392 / DSM 18658 / VKM B-2454 / MOB10) GN=Sinac_5681 PE=4 SV=1: PSCyt1: WD40: WD40: WD40 [Tuwongella immobilis]VTS05608.1 repeat-containing protein : WD40 repeat-containing protein OS=Singulisphaera acidiphila (strain ATCC BAA-1392 / DSM 18658 / VKM B-2454 / MOB10) GN=Sinac_5681 PE=4 SV=1: PSCyt1: WD40: WD40: WD40 